MPDIVTIINRYIYLEKQGMNYIGVCPFHDEQKLSLVVSPKKQQFHCSGCGCEGNVARFVGLFVKKYGFRKWRMVEA